MHNKFDKIDKQTKMTVLCIKEHFEVASIQRIVKVFTIVLKNSKILEKICPKFLNKI